MAALNGLEILSSHGRCCEFCLQRRVSGWDAQGQAVEPIPYYPRAVGGQLILSPIQPFPAIEWLHPGEAEDRAGLRLLTRLPDLYGSRFFDILQFDALYAQAPLFKLAQQVGWDGVITLKQENRDL